MTENEMWLEYSALNPDAKAYNAWAFGGNTPDMPDMLASLVINGIKTATASAYPFYPAEKSPLPKVGEYNIILNTHNEAVCITRTTRVYVTPFSKVPAEHAYKEGEGDRSLRFWRECHSEIFAIELKEINQEFSEDMLVVCEEFEVVYPVK